MMLQVHFSHGEQSFSLNTAPESDRSGGYRRSHRGPKQVWSGLSLSLIVRPERGKIIIHVEISVSPQVVMGLQKPLTVERGEKLYGIIKLTPDFAQHRLIICLTTLNILLLSNRGLMNDNSSHMTRSSLGLHLATSFSGSKSEESEEREYLL